jgi:acetolactate synthase-1/3 small subunit
MTAPLHALTVVMDDRLLTLNAAVGLLRRRNVPVRSVTLGPAAGEGRSRLLAMIEADAAAAARVALLFEKLVGVEAAHALPAGSAVMRELALVRVRPAPDAYGELLDVLNLYHAAVVEEGHDGLVVEVSGPDTFVLSCLRAIERFGIVDVARSGAVLVERPERATLSPAAEVTVS